MRTKRDEVLGRTLGPEGEKLMAGKVSGRGTVGLCCTTCSAFELIRRCERQTASIPIE